jgi:hypothetical protein
LIHKEESKNAVNVMNGMFKVIIGQKMRTLDNFKPSFTRIKPILAEISKKTDDFSKMTDA